MKVIFAMLAFALTLFTFSSTATAAPFAGCHDFSNGGAAPEGARWHYKINAGNPFPTITAVRASSLPADKTFKLIIEDVRFTTYKCWDQNKNLTGFDIEMLTQAAHEAGYTHIEFVPRAWTNYEIAGKKYLSLLIDLISGWGNAVSAGMSITPERQEVVKMIGPIYKAGKKLMARKDNPKINAEKFKDLLQVPANGYDSLRGLAVIEQEAASNIRGAFFKALDRKYPGLIEYLRVDSRTGKVIPVSQEIAANRLLVLEVKDFAVINEFIAAKMSAKVFGMSFDLVMVDTGSTNSLLEEGLLGVETRIVTGNLSSDSDAGAVFGLGDGVSFVKSDKEGIARFEPVFAGMVKSGRIDQLVEKWFNDENAADHSWADNLR